MNSTSTRRSLLARLGRQGPSYSLRLAQTPEDVKGAQALRFLVFNVELNEGLSKSFSSCLDIDEFDAVCDHLLVEDVRTGTIVGTYRLQTGACAQAHLGYYSAREFEFAPFETPCSNSAGRVSTMITARLPGSACCGAVLPSIRGNMPPVT